MTSITEKAEARLLPNFNQLVVAHLVGQRWHSGVSWRRETWAFMVRWDDNEGRVVMDGWARDRYDEALRAMDADFAEVIEWIYVSNLPEFTTKVEDMR